MIVVLATVPVALAVAYHTLGAPDRYAPHYGGYCAQAAARNQVAEGDPELWTIEGGRLFLNYNARFQTRFRSDLTGNIAAADRNWPRLRAGLIEASGAE